MNRICQFCLVAFAVTLLALSTTTALAGGDLKGKIISVNADKFEFVLLDSKDGRKIAFKMAEDPLILVTKQEVKLNALKPDDQATVTYHEGGNDKNLYAVRVQVERK